MSQLFWEGYALSMSDQQIIATFHKRYGRVPAEIWRDRAIAHARPITEDEHRRKRGVGNVAP